MNPAHLFIGTPLDNMRDMWGKGRARPGRFKSGSAHCLAKVTPDMAAEIRRRIVGGEGITAVSKSLGISRQTAHAVMVGAHWTTRAA